MAPFVLLLAIAVLAAARGDLPPPPNSCGVACPSDGWCWPDSPCPVCYTDPTGFQSCRKSIPVPPRPSNKTLYGEVEYCTNGCGTCPVKERVELIKCVVHGNASSTTTCRPDRHGDGGAFWVTKYLYATDCTGPHEKRYHGTAFCSQHSGKYPYAIYRCKYDA
jgi:hypothetical protein